MKKLISTERLRASTTKDSRTAKQQFESDRGRVIFSPAFRRMQSKAQVFSLESNAAVRSRLTHSLEVAHIGKYISQIILEKLSNPISEKDEEQQVYNQLIEVAENIEPIIETACFLHDIGNPPFGHLGEDAIKEWFKSNASNLFEESTKKSIDKNSQKYLDIANFDGNPQGLRIALTLQGEKGKKGLNLTYTQIASLIKYPVTSRDKKEYKKIGIFSSEENEIKKIWEELDLEEGKRHPFVYIMEASDDIAYCLSDIEDGIEKNIISSSEVLEHLRSEFNQISDKEFLKCIPEVDNNAIISPYISFRIRMINHYVKEAASRYISHSLKRDFDKAFFDKDNDDNYSKVLKIIRFFCKEKLYKSPEAEDIEIAGYNIVYGLLEKFSILMKLDRTKFDSLVKKNTQGLHLQNRMFGKLPNKLILHYEQQLSDSDGTDQTEWFLRLQLIIDYISGMTDDFSLQFYRLLNGIEIKTL